MSRPAPVAAWTWAGPAALAALALAGAALAPRFAPAGLVPEPAAWGLAVLAGAAAALHRPLGGGSLGLAAALLPPAWARFGVAPAALAAVVAMALAAGARRWLEGRLPSATPERRGLARATAEAGLAGVAALGAGAAWLAVGGDRAPERMAAAVAAGALVALVLGAGYELAVRRNLRATAAAERLEAVAPLGLDAAGFGVGALLAEVGRRAGWPLAAALGLTLAALAAEAARNAAWAGVIGRRLGESERLSRAGAALATGGSEVARVAGQILAEVRAIVPFSWFQLEVDSPDLGRRSWHAAADSSLAEGEPAPPAKPPALPGIHRRGAWLRLDRVLAADGVRLGELRLWCDPRRLEPRAAELLDALLPQMAGSLRGALLDLAARTDRLTGAASRRVLEQRLTEAFAVAREEGRSMAVVLCDLDHFKRVNDRFGHAAGDRALAAAAAVLLAPARGRDLCARFGGEEFVLLFEETGGETALEIAERLRRRVEALEVEADGVRLELTMSFGVAAFPELHVRGPEELLELADAALYTAKHLGRNLCLLDIGGGRVRTAAGDVLEVAEPPEPRAPVFFA